VEEINYTIIALIVGLAMALIELGKYSVGLFFKYLSGEKSKKKTDNEQEIAIAVFKEKFNNIEEKYNIIDASLNTIKFNDLKHIQKSLDEIEKDNSKEHREIFVVLGRIEESLIKK
jgi:hypothetical protein